MDFEKIEGLEKGEGNQKEFDTKTKITRTTKPNQRKPEITGYG